MTNGEKYKTAKERGAAFKDFCRWNYHCEKCPAYLKLTDGYNYCNFVWLDLEAPMSAKEAADILEKFNNWRNGDGMFIQAVDITKALNKAIEILRSVKE